MDCTNCGAAIPPTEEEFAGTCYGCGEALGYPPFASEMSEALNSLERRVVEIRARELAEDEESIGDFELDEPEEGIDFDENRRSLAETHEFFAPVLPIFGGEEEAQASASRHPTARSSAAPARRTSYQYYQVTGNIGGKRTSYWVEASSDTSARGKYCTYVSEQPGLKLFDRQGHYSWPEEAKKRHPAKRASLDVSEPTHDEPAEYLYRLTSKSPMVLGRREQVQGD